MGQIRGLVYMTRRSGENGKMGPIEDCLQLFEGSPIIEHVLKLDYHFGALEDWEKHMKEHGNPNAVAGDFDHDGDHDGDDLRIIKELSK